MKQSVLSGWAVWLVLIVVFTICPAILFVMLIAYATLSEHLNKKSGG